MNFLKIKNVVKVRGCILKIFMKYFKLLDIFFNKVTGLWSRNRTRGVGGI